MHNNNIGDNSYCPDYYNRERGNKEQKMTLEQWISTRKEE